MKIRRNFSIIALLVFGACLVPSLAGICKAIHIGSDTKSSTINDIVADGETSKLWKEDSYSPVIVTHSKKIEYFYMINLEVDLNSSNVHLKYDNQQYANSSVKVKEEKGKKHWYTLEVVYNCEAYGGALLTYTMEVEVPDCGSASFVWKKVCGYPLTPRDGFTIDMSYSDQKLNIVKNGVPVIENFWDIEVNDWAINIPKDVDSAKFEIYMSSSDIKQKQSSSLLIESTIIGTLETEIGSPKIDSDDAVATVEMTGALVGKGGVVKEDKQVLNINFNCERVKDYSSVEFVIPMTNFRDINLFFYKECDNAGRSMWFWIIVVLVAFLAYKTVINISQGKRGLDMIPYVVELTLILRWLWKTLSDLLQKILNSSSTSSKNSSSRSTKNSESSKSQRYDVENNEFNIKDMSEMSSAVTEFDENKYGTI